MSTSPRLAPLRRLLASRLRPLDTEPWPGRPTADPLGAWRGRIRLDRARVEARPTDADAWWRLGVGLHAIERHDDASAAFLRALRRDLATDPSKQILLITTDVPSFDRVGELSEAVRQVASMELSWICTRPVVFDAALADLPGDGRLYRIAPGFLAPFLRDVAMPHVRAAIAHDAHDLESLPSRMRRMRLPRRLVEDRPADAAGFDRLLAPSPQSHENFAIETSWPVVWPTAPDVPRAEPTVLLRCTHDTDQDGAWSADALVALTTTIAREVEGVDVALWTCPTRRRDALRAWNAVRETGRSLRVVHAAPHGALAHPGSVVICEPGVRAWIDLLRRDAGVVVFDPHDAGCAAPLPWRNTAFGVLEIVHAARRGADDLARARNAARACALYTRAHPGVASLAALLAGMVEDDAATSAG